MGFIFPGSVLDNGSTDTPKLKSIAITPTTSTISVNSTQQYTATGTFSDNTTKDITNKVNWNSSNPSIATISTAGLATGVSVGTTNITASQNSIISNSATLNVIVVPPIACTGPAMQLGNAANLFTIAENTMIQVAADNDINSIVFAHRGRSGFCGTNSSALCFDLSTDGGSNWTNNTLFNNINISNPFSRYPNAAIYNPSTNTDPASAYLSYIAPLTDNSTPWPGYVSGVASLNPLLPNPTSTNTIFAPFDSFIVQSLTKGQYGTMWALSETASLPTNPFVIDLLKGTWNGSNDFVWNSSGTSFSPIYDVNFDTTVHVTNSSVAFDPSGLHGWAVWGGQLNSPTLLYAFYPIFYETTNGGTSWTASPIQLDLSAFSSITDMITVGVPSMWQDFALTVDSLGNPHLFATIVSNTDYAFNETSWHGVYDITQYGMAPNQWQAIKIAEVKGGTMNYLSGVPQNTRNIALRTQDGKKVFFTWIDNSTYTIGQQNDIPNLFSVGLNIETGKWTEVHDFTSCNLDGNVADKIIFPTGSIEVLEPSVGTYNLPIVYANPTYTTPGQPDTVDPFLPASFLYLSGLNWLEAHFAYNSPYIAP